MARKRNIVLGVVLSAGIVFGVTRAIGARKQSESAGPIELSFRNYVKNLPAEKREAAIAERNAARVAAGCPPYES